jgi:hypothetical protein
MERASSRPAALYVFSRAIKRKVGELNEIGSQSAVRVGLRWVSLIRGFCSDYLDCGLHNVCARPVQCGVPQPAKVSLMPQAEVAPAWKPLADGGEDSRILVVFARRCLTSAPQAGWTGAVATQGVRT